MVSPLPSDLNPSQADNPLVAITVSMEKWNGVFLLFCPRDHSRQYKTVESLAGTFKNIDILNGALIS
jgi:hypothetical protein